VVALLGAPAGFVKKTLGPVPEGAVLREDLRAPFNVGLLFVDSKAELAKRFPAVQKAMGEPCALWLFWPKKTSGVPTDLAEHKIRDFVLMAVSWTTRWPRWTRRGRALPRAPAQEVGLASRLSEVSSNSSGQSSSAALGASIILLTH
jgi:hypothetical protein